MKRPTILAALLAPLAVIAACTGGGGPLPTGGTGGDSPFGSSGSPGTGGGEDDDDDDDNGGNGGNDGCEPGSGVSCRCDSGGQGTRFCLDDRRSYTPCVCLDGG